MPDIKPLDAANAAFHRPELYPFRSLTPLKMFLKNDFSVCKVLA